MADRFVPNAIVSEGRCKKSCHVAKTESRLCIQVTPASKTTFLLCIGCGLCVKNPNLTYFLESYFTRAGEETLKTALKAQHVYQIPKNVQGDVGKMLAKLDERRMMAQICAYLGLDPRSKHVILKAAQVICSLLLSRMFKFDKRTTMSDLPDDMTEEILSRVPLTSLSGLRSTCKKWDALSKDRIFGKSARRKQFMGFMMMDYRVCSMKLDLQGILNEGDDLVSPCIKQVSILDQVEISKIFHCDGLLLCVTKDNSRLLVWNPYLGQTRWIQPRNTFHRLDRYGLGYDKNRNHKILRIFGEYGSENHYMVYGYEVYDLSSDSWKVVTDNPDWHIEYFQRGVSLKGTSYFLAGDRRRSGYKIEDLLSFDYTRDKFGKRLPMPFKSHNVDTFVSLSCVREEKLAVLHQSWVFGHSLEIWVTTEIDPCAVSWSKFLRFTSGCVVDPVAGSFFIDEEKKVAVVLELDDDKRGDRIVTRCNQTANIIGQDGYFKSVNIGEARNLGKVGKCGFMVPEFCCPLVCSSYVPSTVQLNL